MKFNHYLSIALVGSVLGILPLSASAVWEDKFYNPKPLADDVILPMPCGGAMVFRKISIPLSQPLQDYNITLGGGENDEWGYLEQARAEYIAGSFAEGKSGKGRYFLMAKYELTDLQYQALSGTCPTPNMRLRLPKVNIGWIDAMNLANQYNLWLLKNQPESLPNEDGKPGFLRLPTETEWEFAARGGLAVSTSEFRDQHFPMPEGITHYAWFSGAQSANGKLQLTGLLKPNPLGLHDMLGNTDEMMFEPFRLNKLDRQHGQAGGYIVRGGSFLTPESDIRSSLRGEEPYYTVQGENKNKAIGFRLVLVSPTLTSRDRIKEIAKEWKTLGVEEHQNKGKKSTDSIDYLGSISSKIQDASLKKQLAQLRADLRANAQLRDEQRDQAIRTSLQLGAFLCTKLKDDGDFYDRLVGLYGKTCKSGSELDANCSRRQTQLEQHKKALNFIVNYYADTLVDMGITYNAALIAPQLRVVQQEMSARGKTNLNSYLNTYWQNLQGYWRDGRVARDSWLEMCKKNK
ncbi:SUMF1/EgtB/PvdO family nonheme iron enzyme [Xenorhabdus sp. PB61.4]|uniref:SUMF1/EgtB/PvdO family nonheme iron enzyme n=1 Tax=Xenorhabdus sp. PB61.4 TaxID=2788940 RepID=UPI001E52622B|nr:SUMF1/EgtB/PvdO family nonheme iron enzyme [Xenorhabdus sp. PB61.4]